MSAAQPPPLLSAQSAAPSQVRDRILAAAYELFSRHGIRAVGIDAIIHHSGVAKMTLYRHFPSKEDLVLAFLDQRWSLWTGGWLTNELERRATTARDRLLAIFDVFDDWFRTPGFEGCAFINVMLETTDADSPVRRATVGYLKQTREYVEGLARAAGVADPVGFAAQWHMLMKGSIVTACEGDVDAAKRARALGTLLLASEGVRASAEPTVSN